MKKIITVFIGIMAVVCFAGTPSFAVLLPDPVLSLYTYQGTVFVDDLPFDGTGFFKLAIVNDTGQTLWSNDSSSVDGSEPTGSVAIHVDDGFFSIILGNTVIPGMTAIDPIIFTTMGPLFLKSWFDDGAHGFSELTPPISITANAYAINAQYLRGYAPSDFFLNSGQIVTSQIAPSAVGTTQIAAASVTDDKITAFSNNSTIFTIGSGAATTNVIYANQAGANDPGLRYDSGTSKWQFSNNGVLWTDIGGGGGGGTVNAGLINQMTYYAAAGTTVSGLATAANGVLATNAGGAPSITSALPAAVQGNITTVGTVTSGVWNGTAVDNAHVADNLTINGGTVDNSPIGSGTASTGIFTDLTSNNDTVVQGGDVTIGVGTTAYAGRVVLHDANAGSSNTTTLKSADNVGANFTLTLPADDGAVDQVLKTDGSGILSWVNQTSTSGFIKADGSVPYTAGPQSFGGINITNVGTISVGTLQATGASFTVGSNWTNLGNTVANIGTVNGGTIDGTAIGGSTAAAGKFTSLEGQTIKATTSAQLEDPAVGINTITNQAPNGLAGSYTLTWPVDDGNASQVLSTDGSGILSWVAQTSTSGFIKADGSVPYTAGPQSFGDINITNVGDIALDSISGDANAITIGDGADTVTVNPTTETSFSDKNITNVGDVALDSISGDANAITIGDGADTVTVNPTAATSFSDKNITNVGVIDLDTIQGDGGAIAIGGAPTDLITMAGTITGGNALVFDGGGPGVNTTTFAITAPTANRTITFKNESGTVAYTSDIVTGAPVDATYITQTANGTLTNEQALSGLATGIMQVTTGTGVVSSVTTSAGVATLIGDETGSGALTFATSPSLTTPTVNTSLTVTDDDWIGLGGAAGRIEYDDQATDEVNILSAVVGIGTATPQVTLDVNGDARVQAQGDVRFADADSSNYVAFQSPGVVVADVTWTLPAADGGAGTFLSTSGGGTLSWASAGGAPTDATYITQTANATLTNEQALSGLATGIMQVTTGTGVVSSVTTSAGVASLIGDETGSGAMVFGTSPTIATPTVNTSLTVPDNTWMGLGAAAGRIEFDDQATDEVNIMAALMGIGTATPSYLLDVNGTIRTGTPGTSGALRIYSEQGATDYEVVFQPSGSMTQNTTYTWPVDDGAASQLLTTDGSGALSWTSAASGNTLDGAYDQGGAGAGRTITVDSGAVRLNGSGLSTNALEVYDSGTAAGIFVENSGTGTSLRVNDVAADTTPFIIDDAGNVGIGTPTPGTNVHIYESNTDTEPALRIEQASTGDAAQRFLRGASNIAVGIDQNDNDNYKIGNTSTLTGTTYADANTMMRIHTEAGNTGIIDFNNQSRARAYRNAAQNIGTGAWTLIPFDTASYNSKTELNTATGVFTAKTTGYYQVNARTQFTLPALGTLGWYVSIAIYVNGAVYSYGTQLAVTTTAGATERDIVTNNAPNVSDVVFLTAGQTLDIRAYQNTGANRAIVTGTAQTYVSIHKLS